MLNVFIVYFEQVIASWEIMVAWIFQNGFLENVSKKDRRWGGFVSKAKLFISIEFRSSYFLNVLLVAECCFCLKSILFA